MKVELKQIYTRFVTAKEKHALSFFGFVLYSLMIYFLKCRFINLARFIGEFLQARFSSNYSVNSALAIVYRQQNEFIKECMSLMRIMPSEGHDIDLLFRASESASFAGDVQSLLRLRDMAEPVSVSMHSYINGLLAFERGDANYTAYFQESIRSYLDPEGTITTGDPVKVVSKLLLKAFSSHLPLPEHIRSAANIRDYTIIDELLESDLQSSGEPLMLETLDLSVIAKTRVTGPVVLISCSIAYFRIFADFYMRTVRQKNRNIVHFHVVTTDKEIAKTRLEELSSKYTNVGYTVASSSGNAQTNFTLPRFIICHELMQHYGSDILISDIDLHVDFDLGSMSRELRSQRYDFGLLVTGYHAPWGKYGCGFSYFRVDNHASEMYLDIFSRYLVWLNCNGGYFSMDMVGAMIAHDYMLKQGCEFSVLDLSAFANLMKMHRKIPKKLQLGKIRAKFRDGTPQ